MWSCTSRPTASILPSPFQHKAVTVHGRGRLHRRCQLSRCTLRLLLEATIANRSIVGHHIARTTSWASPLFSNSVMPISPVLTQEGHVSPQDCIHKPCKLSSMLDALLMPRLYIDAYTSTMDTDAVSQSTAYEKAALCMYSQGQCRSCAGVSHMFSCCEENIAGQPRGQIAQLPLRPVPTPHFTPTHASF